MEYVCLCVGVGVGVRVLVFVPVLVVIVVVVLVPLPRKLASNMSGSVKRSLFYCSDHRGVDVFANFIHHGACQTNNSIS